MAETTEPLEALRMVVIFLRFYARLSQAELGRAAGLAQSQVSALELGDTRPSEDILRRIAAAAEVPWYVVTHLRYFCTAFTTAAKRGNEFGLESAAFKERDLLPLSSYWLEEAAEAGWQSSAEARREAERFWDPVKGLPSPRRRRAVELSPKASKSWALAERLCHESAAAASPEEALELADLALGVAGRAEGEEGWKRRLQGYAWAFVGNARRAAKDLAGADAAFAQSRELWRSGADPEGLLEEGRMLSLEGFAPG